MSALGWPEDTIRSHCERICPTPGIEQVLSERIYYEYERQWPVAEAGPSAVKVIQEAMALTTGSLWPESHQSEQTDMFQTGTGQYRC